MLIRAALLFACSAGALYVFLSLVKNIDGRGWKIFCKIFGKILLCITFGGLVVLTAGIISQLTN